MLCFSLLKSSHSLLSLLPNNLFLSLFLQHTCLARSAHFLFASIKMQLTHCPAWHRPFAVFLSPCFCFLSDAQSHSFSCQKERPSHIRFIQPHSQTSASQATMTTETPRPLRSTSWLKFKAAPLTASYIPAHIIPGAGMLAGPREAAMPARRSTNEAFGQTLSKGSKSAW